MRLTFLTSALFYFSIATAVPLSEHSNGNTTAFLPHTLGMCYDNTVSREVWRMAIERINARRNGWEHLQIDRDRAHTVYDHQDHVVRLWTTKDRDSVTSGAVAATMRNLLAAEWCYINDRESHGFSKLLSLPAPIIFMINNIYSIFNRRPRRSR
jgi:hypothetical protein